jgi:zinc protease
MTGRFHEQYTAIDLTSDVLGRGASSRLYQQLVKERELFTSISSFVMGTLDPGALIISGRLRQGVSPEQGEQAIDEVVSELRHKGISQTELTKVKNQAATTLEFDEVEVMNRAMNLAFATLSGDTHRVNEERHRLDEVTRADIHAMADAVLRDEKSSVLYYEAKSTAA